MEEKDLLINTLVQKQKNWRRNSPILILRKMKKFQNERTFLNPSVELTCEECDFVLKKQGRIEDSCENKTFEKY